MKFNPFALWAKFFMTMLTGHLYDEDRRPAKKKPE